MKLKHLFLSALAITAFIACSNEAEEIKSTEKSVTATVEIDLEGEYNNDQTRALTFDGTEYPLFTHETGVTDWKTHCFIRNEAGTVQFYALVDWNATTDSDGNISLHIKNSTLTLQNSAGSDVSNTETLPKAGERWYIAGMAGGGVLEANNAKVNFSHNEILDANLKPNQLRVPIAFGWTPFTIAKSVSERAPRIVVQFKPQGTLLSVRVNNTTAVNSGQFGVSGPITLTTNALTTNGAFDYTPASTTVVQGANPTFSFVNATAVQEVITRNVAVSANASKTYVLWGYPRPADHLASGSNFSTVTTIPPYRTYNSTAKTAAVIRTKAYANAMAYLTTVYVERPIMALEYVADYNMASSTAFATTHSNSSSVLFDWDNANTLFETSANFKVKNVGYHLPTIEECRGIFPPDDLAVWGTANTHESPSEQITIKDNTATYKGKYYSTGNQTSYALRFTNTSNNLQTAYRYRAIGTFADGSSDSYIEVTARYVGSDFSDDVTTLASKSDDFWTAEGLYVQKKLPMWGDNGASIGLRGFYWSSSPDAGNSSNAWDMNLYPTYGHTTGLSYAKTKRLAVRLFKNSVE